MDDKKILDTLYEAYKDAQEKDLYDNANFNPDKYEWELGAKIAHTLMYSYCNYYSGAFDTVHKCMDINVRINYKNPTIIQLWKKQFEVIL